MKLRSRAPCVEAELENEEQGDEAAKLDKVLRGVGLGVGLAPEEGVDAHDHAVSGNRLRDQNLGSHRKSCPGSSQYRTVGESTLKLRNKHIATKPDVSTKSKRTQLQSFTESFEGSNWESDPCLRNGSRCLTTMDCPRR